MAGLLTCRSCICDACHMLRDISCWMTQRTQEDNVPLAQALREIGLEIQQGAMRCSRRWFRVH